MHQKHAKDKNCNDIIQGTAGGWGYTTSLSHSLLFHNETAFHHRVLQSSHSKTADIFVPKIQWQILLEMQKWTLGMENPLKCVPSETV